MADLVPISDPTTGKTYRVHPWIAEQGEWIATNKAALRAQLPGMEAFERGVALVAKQHAQDRTAQHA